MWIVFWIFVLIIASMVFALWLVRKVARASSRSILWREIFLKLTGYQPENAKPVVNTPKPPMPEMPKTTEYKEISECLRHNMGFTAKETKSAIEYVESMIPEDTTDNKIFKALCYLGGAR